MKKFDRTPINLETKLSRLDNESDIDKFIKNKELKFFYYTTNEFAKKVQKYETNASLKNENAIVFWSIIKKI